MSDISRDTHRAAFPLTGAGAAWRVDSGAVDVFFVHASNGVVNAPYKHVLRATAGQLIFGVDSLDSGDDGQLEVWARGLPGFSLRATTVDELTDDDAETDVAAQVDLWITGFTDSVARDIMPVPRADAFVAQGRVPDLQSGKVVAARGGVVWLSGLGTASYLGLVDAADDETDWLPLTLQGWLTVSGPQEGVVATSSRQLHDDGLLEEALCKFHRRLLDAERVNRLLAVVDEANLQMDRSTLRREHEEQARTELKRLFEQTRSDAAVPALHEALSAIGDYEGIDFRFPDTDPDDSVGDPVVEIAFGSRVRARAVRLTSIKRWWFGDSSALLGFHNEDGSPIVLLPGRFGRYKLWDPATRKTTIVGRSRAGKLHKYAWMFIRPLPDRPVKAKDAWKLFANKTGIESIRYALGGLVAGLISFAPATMVAVVVDWLVPARSDAFLWWAIAALALLAIAGVLVQLSQSTTLLHVEGRGAARLTAAVWDRLLRLKRDDLRGFKTGEVSQRAFVVQALRENLSGIVAGTVSSILFLLPILGLLFLYDPTLATTSLALGILGLIIVASFGLRQVKWQRRYHDAQQTLAGNMFQFVNGIEKLRSTGAESSVFAFWVRGYLDKKQAEIKVERLNALATAVTGSLPMFAAACLFGVVLLRPGGPIEVGTFLAVFAASMTFFSAVTRLGGSVGVVASLVPAYQQIKPLFDPSIETRTSANAAPIRRIQGGVRLDHVTFSYDDGPPVVRDVSLHVRAGEFVAIVGESGSGKSSLLRLILGLEQPSTGAVYFDERNLAYLDDHALRRQIGVVMQNGSLQPGTILQNIVGINSEATLEDAWSAARKASLADDIRAMEMGMHTPVGEHSGLFSGGQVQRILIAAALVRNPSVILLDEATNWLDNKSQAQVMRSIAEIAATRIVVAHRLSTIKNADRIYVLSQGQIVQTGTFDELAATAGMFRDLIARQVA